MPVNEFAHAANCEICSSFRTVALAEAAAPHVLGLVIL